MDQSSEMRGYGRQAVQTAVTMFKEAHGPLNIALSYDPPNLTAKRLYNKLGFVETDEWEDNEVVARLSFAE